MEKRKQLLLSSVKNSFALLVTAFALFSNDASGQQSLETQYRMTGDKVTSAFEPQRQVIQKISAVIIQGRKQVTYGLVVSADGYILTKASEIEGITNLEVRIDTEVFKTVEVAMVDPRWDVALVKVDAQDLVVPEYAEKSDLPQGSWVIVNGAAIKTKRRVNAGVISANAREIMPAGGAVLGVVLKEDKGKLIIGEVSEGSGAQKGGLKEGDRIVSVDGNKLDKTEALMEVLVEMLKDKKAGNKVVVRVMRDKEELDLEIVLSSRKELFPEMDRNDMMSGAVSERRSGFPRVIQHDVLGNRSTMGGPVLNFEGKVIGMNIARANRAETFAIPVEELRDLIAGMIAQAKK